jgi:cell shape-determining protein MreC
MPNPLGRRSSSTSKDVEISALKQELADLKSLYLADMANISADMQTLNSKVITPETSETP